MPGKNELEALLEQGGVIKSESIVGTAVEMPDGRFIVVESARTPQIEKTAGTKAATDVTTPPASPGLAERGIEALTGVFPAARSPQALGRLERAFGQKVTLGEDFGSTVGGELGALAADAENPESQINRRTRGAVVGGLTSAPLGPTAMIAGAAMGGAFPPERNELGSLAGAAAGEAGGLAVGETVLTRLAERALKLPPGSVKRLKKVPAILRTLYAAGGAGAGAFAGIEIDEKVFGTRVESPGGTVFFLSVATGAGRTLENVLARLPRNAVAQAANRLARDPKLAEAGTELSLGAAEFTGKSFFNALTRGKLGRQAKGAAEVIDAYFPSELTDDAILNVKRRLADTFTQTRRAATSALGEGVDTTTRESRIRISQSIRKELGISPAEDAALAKLVKNRASEVDAFLRQLGTGAGRAAKLNGTLLSGLKKVLDPADFEPLANEFIRREIIGRALLPAGGDILAGFMRRGSRFIVDGKALRQSVETIGAEALDGIYGAKRSQVLRDLADLLDFADPRAAVRRRGGSSLSGQAARYARERLLWIIPGAALASSTGNLGQAAGLAGGAIAVIGLADVIRLTANNPSFVRLLRAAAEDSSGRAGGVLLRSLASGQADRESVAPPTASAGL